MLIHINLPKFTSTQLVIGSYVVLWKERLYDVVVSCVRRDMQRREVLHPRHVEAAGEAALAGVERLVAVAAVAAAQPVPPLEVMKDKKSEFYILRRSH